ncbi:MAG: tetratricopeptide repeat protein [Candidatus Omnitrophota bacterium]|nr:tetratricopeptide repeat protein [Candidatus Omnitrophota bacterium]
MKKLLLFSSLALTSVFFCYPETVKLKSGKIVEGKILEKTDQYVSIDVSGVVLKYYLDEIDTVGQLPPALDSNPTQSSQDKIFSEDKEGNKQTFEDKEWGYSFQYPSNWEIIPKEELAEGLALGLRPKEKSSVEIVIQKGNLSEEDVKGLPTLRDLVKLYFPLKGFKIGTLVPMADDAGYLVRLLPEKKKTIKYKDIEGMQGDAYLPFLPLKDCYFLTALLSSQRKDRRYIVITIDYKEFLDMFCDVDTPKNKEILRKFELEKIGYKLKEDNKKTEKYRSEAEGMIDSFRYSFDESLNIDNKKIVPPLPKEEIPPLEKEISSQINANSKPIPIGKMQELQDCFRKGYKYLSDKQYKEAIAEFEKALQIDPNHATALYLLGRTYFSLAQYQRALEYYQKVLQAAPNYVEAYIDMGNISVSLNRFEEAVAYFNKALKISPDNVAVYNGLGFAYGSMSQYKEAVDYFKKAIQINNDNAESYTGLGLIYFSSGQYQEAKENFLKAKEILQRNGDSQGVKAIDEYLRSVP